MAAGIAAEAGLVAKKALAVWLSVETPLVLSGQSGETKLDNAINIDSVFKEFQKNIEVI